MCVGVKGRGVEEANFLHAFALADVLMTDTTFAGGDVGIRKCFDQLALPLVVALAAVAGMPAG
eukprot:90727-Lingulodinium_polyedra.AAC.1